TFFAVNISRLSSFHTARGSECSLCLKPMINSDRYGVVVIDEHQRIHSFKEKKWYASSLINGGVYVLNKTALLSKKLPQKFSFEKEYLEKFYSSQPMFGQVQDEYFIDIGIPDDYNQAQIQLIQNC
ncbi:MAG: sugar phosphate nucleotidyltransferase, partial [Flavitalea sp.]